MLRGPADNGPVVILGLAVLTAALLTLFGFLVRLAGHLPRAPRALRISARSLLLAYLLLLPVAVFVVTPLGLAQLIGHAGTRPRDRAPGITPKALGRSFAEVTFPSRDGIELSGWLLEGFPGRPAVILGHGLFRSRREMLERAVDLNTLGYPALLFDFRSHGASQKATVSLGYLESRDVLGAAEFLHRREPGRPLALLGVSMGAVAAIHAATEIPPERLAGLIADSPFQSLRETVLTHTRLFLGLPPFPFSDLFIWNLTRINGYSAGDLDTVRALQTPLQVPVLLIYGSEDRRMPESTARTVFEAVPHGRRRLLFFEGAGHGAAYRTDPDRYVREVDRWLRRGGS